MVATLLGLCNFSGASLAVTLTGSCPMSHDMNMHSEKMDVAATIRKKADAECGGCHGNDGNGINANDDVPNLAGQDFMYLCSWLESCRKQGAHCASHEDLAAQLSDHDIVGFAMYYTHLPSIKW
jgi:cytochrome c553